MAEITDHYQTLDVPETASAAEIKRAYRRLARVYHPDRNAGDTSVIERFRAIQEAYEVLADPATRAAYDQMRRDPLSVFGGSGYSPSLNEMHAHLFGNGRVEARSGRDAEAEVRLSFEQSLAGGKAEVRLRDGTALQVPIPKGVRSGVKVRFRDRAPTHGDHAPGDLYVTFRVAPSSRFRREGNDLHIVEPVTVMEALLGTSRAITDAYGRGIKATIPPGTQPGERLRLRGQGVRTATQKGDLYVEVRVTVPRSLTEEQRIELSACVRKLGLI
ncbi:MAG: J domain-containing protein [Bacteroidota bacterium]